MTEPLTAVPGQVAPTVAAASRRRVVAWYLLLFGASVLVAMIPIQRALHRDLDRAVTADLETEVENLRTRAGTFEAGASGPDEITPAILTEHLSDAVPADDTVLVGLDGDRLVATVPTAAGRDLATPDRIGEWVRADEAEWGTIEDAADPFRWLRVSVGDHGTFVAAQDLTDRQAQLTTTSRVLFLMAAVMLALGGVIPALWRRRRRMARVPVDPTWLDFQDPVDWATEAAPNTSDDRPGDLDLRLVDVAELTDGMVRRARIRYPERRWELAASAAGDLICDVDQVHQAVARLVGRAFANTADGEVIPISSHDIDAGRGVCFVVAGQGADVDPGTAGPTDDPMVRAVIERHAGRLSVEAVPGRHGVVSACLPRVPGRR